MAPAVSARPRSSSNGSPTKGRSGRATVTRKARSWATLSSSRGVSNDTSGVTSWLRPLFYPTDRLNSRGDVESPSAERHNGRHSVQQRERNGRGRWTRIETEEFV